MAKNNYKIRVLHYDCYKLASDTLSNLSYSDALDRFLFYAHAALELGLGIRCVNIMLGNKSIKMFQNH